MGLSVWALLLMLGPGDAKPRAFVEALRKADRVAATTESVAESARQLSGPIQMAFQVISVDAKTSKDDYIVSGIYIRTWSPEADFKSDFEKRQAIEANQKYSDVLKTPGTSGGAAVSAAHERDRVLRCINQHAAERRDQYARIAIRARISRSAPFRIEELRDGSNLTGVVQIDSLTLRAVTDETVSTFDCRETTPLHIWERKVHWNDLKLPTNIISLDLAFRGPNGDWPTGARGATTKPASPAEVPSNAR